jgi:hypothetical protein
MNKKPFNVKLASTQTIMNEIKDYKISICCFTTKHAALRSMIKDWLAWNWGNEWSGISTCRLLILAL